MNKELKEKLLKNNTESERRSRKCKKETLYRLMKENVELRNKQIMFKTRLHYCLCMNCKEKLNIVPQEKKSFICIFVLLLKGWLIIIPIKGTLVICVLIVNDNDHHKEELLKLWLLFK